MFFKVKKIHADAHLPVRKTTGSAGYDLYAYESSEIESRRCRKIPTGLKMEIPEGYYGKIESRSSLALDNLHVEGGVIDSDYRGEVSVILCNNNDNSVKVNRGDRIAQIILTKIIVPEILEVEEFSSPMTSRGEGGFGSTGTN